MELDIEMLGEQLGDTLQEFVADDPEGWLAQLFIQAFHGLLKRRAEQ